MGTTLTEEQYHLKWNDYHSSLTKCFLDLRNNDEMLDVAIIADGRTFKAHKLVLSACSPVFKAMLKKGRNQPFLQPFIFLHGVNYEDIQAILDFMYNGEVSVNQDGLRSFLSIAEDLRVRGLTQNDHANSRKTEEAGMLQDVDSRPYNGNGNVPRNRKRMRSNSVEQEETEIRSPNNHLSHHQINNGHISAEPSSPRKSVHSAHTSPFRQDYPMMPLSPHTPAQNSASRRGSSSLDGGGHQDQGGLGTNVSYHYLGGRDHGDPLSNMTVARSERGWHCPDCIHIATTKGNLKSHILSGRHKLAEKLFKCRFCDRSYATKQSMQVHISTNHRNERDSMSMQGVPNLPHHGSENEDIKRVPNITLNYSDDDGDSNEAHMGLPVETTYDENSHDGNLEHQEIPGKHDVLQHHLPERLPVAPLPLPEHHQANNGNQGVARHHYDN